MSHPLVDQFRFTRNEWLRGLEGVSEGDAARHFGPMNCISWIVGHYWFHNGEIQAVRQMLGQSSLPEYVGDIEIQAPYRPE